MYPDTAIMKNAKPAGRMRKIPSSLRRVISPSESRARLSGTQDVFISE